MPRLLGLTGNIASGKTTIGHMLLDRGAATYIDADAVVHQLYLPDQPVYQAVVQTFGAQFGGPNGIDRQALGALVFQEPAALQRLEAIVHPAVGAAVQARLAMLAPTAIAVIDAVKLLEGRMGGWCEQVWLVWCDPAEERRRLITDRGQTPAEADARLAAQPDREHHRHIVAAVIDNSGSLAATEVQVAAAWQHFMHQA